jgi:hypothetical protein
MKLVGLTCCVTALAALAATVRWQSIEVEVGDAKSRYFGLGLGAGSLVVWVDSSQPYHGKAFQLKAYGAIDSIDNAIVWWAQAGRIWPAYVTHPLGFQLVIPIWIILASCGLATLCLWHFDRRRPAPGTCHCGYDLTGNTSGRCPECGAAT